MSAPFSTNDAFMGCTGYSFTCAFVCLARSMCASSRNACLLHRYVGLKNLGNSCYLNSVLQVLWTLPEAQHRYASAADSIFQSAPADPTTDLPTQVLCPAVWHSTGSQPLQDDVLSLWAEQVLLHCQSQWNWQYDMRMVHLSLALVKCQGYTNQ